MGIVIAYMILAAQFNSFFQPIVVLLALPFSISGALIALYLSGQGLNVYSAIGFILLMGIVKKNSIIMVDYTNQLRTEGLSIQEALIKACPIRLRPIIMTSLSTAVGAIPAMISRGPGFETRVPMAMAVFGGVIISTLLTLYIVPAGYSLSENLLAKIKKA
jgi:HAE1 family hydrophobic/amphiphilic exporter-1